MSEPVAIIGLACRFPGAQDAEAFWRLLWEGREAITEIPKERWDARSLYDPTGVEPGRANTVHAGFIDHPFAFDPHFFGISPREAAWMDPQQRILLEVAWQALEDAGQTRGTLAGSATGVFVGSTANDYAFLLSHPEVVESLTEPYLGTGISVNVLSGRLSYVFDLRGPSMTIDTACSSSLVAVHLACQSLATGESDLAIAAGVHLMLAPVWHIAVSKLSALAPDGRCKTFDARADGYGRGEGAGVVVLKSLTRALADRDRIYGVIRGSAVNQDGRSNGLTAPSGHAQEALLRRALKVAGAKPDAIQYVEVHGTGTALGDPIELTALGSVLSEGRPKEQRCAVGSVKTNIGHLEGAAGVASLIKVALSLQHQELPASLHFREPNPHIPFDRLPLAVQNERGVWPAGSEGRWAGVSAFGWAGTNAHLVLCEAPDGPLAEKPDAEQFALLLTGHTPEALRQQAENYRRLLADVDAPALADVCRTAAVRRTHHARRLSVVGRDRAGLALGLERFAAGQVTPETAVGVAPRRRQGLVLVFSGQGTAWLGMARALLQRPGVMRECVEEVDAVCRRVAGWSVATLLAVGEQAAELRHTDRAQMAVFALQIALARWLSSVGVRPDAVLGHSLGEISAACVAGALSLPAAVELVHLRGVLMRKTEGRGRMLALSMTEDQAASLVAEREEISIAAINADTEVVLSGNGEVLDAMRQRLDARGVECRYLDVDYAFHSPEMDGVSQALRASEVTLDPQRGTLPIMSSVTGAWVEGERLDSSYWALNARAPVRFAAAMTQLKSERFGTFVELAPHAALSGSMRSCLGGIEAGAVITTLQRGRDGSEMLLRTLGALWTRGERIDWSGVLGQGPSVSLPAFPFQRETFRAEGAVWRSCRTGTVSSSTEAAATDSGMSHFYVPAWSELPVAPGEPAPLPGTWLVVGEEQRLRTALRERLSRAGANVVLVGREQRDLVRLLRTTEMLPIRGIVYLSACSVGETCDAERCLELSCGALLSMLQGMSALEQGTPPRIWIVTRGAQPADAITVSESAIWQAAEWGLGRVLRLERPDLWGGALDLDPTVNEPDVEAGQVLAQLNAADGEDCVAWRSGRRLGARLASVELAAREPRIRPDGSYLVTGGSGAIGRRIVAWLVEQGATSVIIASRRGSTADAGFEELRGRGATLTFRACDSSREEQVRALLAEIDSGFPPLVGIFHAAGVLDDHTLANQSWERMRDVLAPKMLGAVHLHRLTRNRALDLFVLLSSASALLGSSGQASYVAANAGLDALAHHRRSLGLAATAINFGLWSGEGMGGALGEAQERRWRAFGVRPLDPVDGITSLARVLADGRAQVAVLPIDWALYRARTEPLTGRQAMLESLGSRASGERPDPGSPAPASVEGGPGTLLEGAGTRERPELLLSYLRSVVAQVLGLDRARIIDTQQGFFDMGIDSLTTVEILSRLRNEIGVTLSASALFNHPTLARLTAHLLEVRFGQRGQDDPAPPSATVGLDDAKLAALVDDEIAQVLGVAGGLS